MSRRRIAFRPLQRTAPGEAPAAEPLAARMRRQLQELAAEGAEDRARVAEARRPLLDAARALRDRTGDATLFGDLDEDGLVAVVALAADFGGRHVLGPFRLALEERWFDSRREADSGLLAALEAGYLSVVSAAGEDGKPAGEAIVELVEDRDVGLRGRAQRDRGGCGARSGAWRPRRASVAVLGFRRAEDRRRAGSAAAPVGRGRSRGRSPAR